MGSSTAAGQKPQQAAAQASQPKDSGHREIQEKSRAAVRSASPAQASVRPKQSQSAAELQHEGEQQGDRLRVQSQSNTDAGAASLAASGPHGGAQQGRDSEAAARPMPSAAASQARRTAEEASTRKMPHTDQQVQRVSCHACLHGTVLYCISSEPHLCCAAATERIAPTASDGMRCVCSPLHTHWHFMGGLWSLWR